MKLGISGLETHNLVLTPCTARCGTFEDAYYAGLEAENNNSDTNEDVPDVVMRLYLEVFQNYPDKADDVEFITNKYIELISASNELTAEEKEIIYSALSVAASSYEYWENSQK